MLNNLYTAAFASLGPKTPVSITVIVAVKRHHTRMFPTYDVPDRNGNVNPGTVIENSPNNDIFLVAHPGLQGTVRPTRYVSIFDENKIPPDVYQRITNNLCWTYARSTCAVSLSESSAPFLPFLPLSPCCGSAVADSEWKN